MTKTVLMLVIAGAMMAGCATTPTAPNAGSNVAPQNTYRVQGGLQQAQVAPVVAPAAPCIGCGDPTYFDRVMAGYDFRRPFPGGCGECGGDVWRYGIPGPTTWMPICPGGDCAPPVAPPVAQPEPQPTPEPTPPPHTKGDTPTTAPTTMPEGGTTTVNY